MEPIQGKIIEWNRERGFGYVDNAGRRVFLHIRDFKVRHRWPEVGDVVQFVMGQDKHGRSCAQEAVQADVRGNLKVGHILLLAGLLVLPGYALRQLASPRFSGYAIGWVLVVSWFTWMRYAWDKQQARGKGWRETEMGLHLMELIGGWPGAFLAQRLLRHKSSKGPYQFVFVLIIGLHQFLAIDALRGWPFIHLVLRAGGKGG
ncbi:MAG: hypothetical protein RL091_1947 [Verrucomicrobiota bacterium]|jgi:uncharacterized membrane protein YsdA (DUF1294 family)/cold shock CspA family protein